MSIARTRLHFDENPRIDWVWVWVWESPTFSIGHGDRNGDAHIPAIIPVSATSLSSFKLLKYSQLSNHIYIYIYIYNFLFP